MTNFKLPKNNTHFDQLTTHAIDTDRLTIENAALDQKLPSLYIHKYAVQIVGWPGKGSLVIPFDNLK